MPGMDHGTPTSIPASAAFNGADVTFAQQMIVHHQQAVRMAELAPSRAADPEVKALAAAIKAAQQPEIDQMTGWLTTWKQPTSATHDMGNGMPGMMSGQDMSGLAATTGSAFDKEFVRLMIAHHQGAVTMARDIAKNGSHPDVRRLAATIEQAQTAEIAQMHKIAARL